jgi:hypothetical protein
MCFTARIEMSAIRIVRSEDTELISVIDEATGLSEVVEVSATDDKTAVDTIIEDEPDLSSRKLYTP